MGQNQGYLKFLRRSPTEYKPNGREEQRMWCSKRCFAITVISVILSLAFLALGFFLGRNSIEKLPHPVTVTEVTNETSPIFTNISRCVISPDVPINLTGDHMDIDSNVTEEMEVVTAISMQTEAEKPDPLDLFRLPDNLRPSKYRIKIIPLLFDLFENNLTTIGEVNIHFECIISTNMIVLNAKDLTIKETITVSELGRNVHLDIVEIRHDPKNERFSIILSQDLTVNTPYSVHIEFIGKINDMPSGVYRSSYVDVVKERWLLSTLFSPSDARQAYPSFDEPSLKAQFTFSIARPKGYITLSNMNIKDTIPVKDMPDWLWDNYHESPLMSTYLTAFVVAPFKALLDFKHSTNLSRPIVNGYARPNALSQISYAIELAPKIVNYFEVLFGINYPLSKLDIIAVPSQFYNAMENWGLIIFRESSLFIMPNSTEALKQKTALTLAHEICHQWLGNLVTQKWWNDLWLKEGLSTYFQYLAIDHLMPDSYIFNQFVRDETEVAFAIDALLSSHALSHTVNKPTKEIFDTVSYHKGSAIIRMLTNFIGESTADSGIASFLRKYAFKNFEQDDLWTELHNHIYNNKKHTTVNIKAVMDSWTLQAGFPVVTFGRDYENGNMNVYQERFFLSDKIDKKSLWHIPISYVEEPESEFQAPSIKKFWLNTTNLNVQNLPIGNRWILANINNTGFYRVNYDIKNWEMLISSYHILPPNTRAQLLSDSFHLARSGKLKYNIAFSMASQLSTDTDYIPWDVVSSSFEYLRNTLINMPAYGNLRSFVLIIMQKVYTPLKDTNQFNNFAEIEGLSQVHRTNILSMACLFKHQHCINNAIQLFRRFLEEPDERYETPKSVREFTYCTATSQGGRAEWEYLYAEYRRATVAGEIDRDEQQRLVKAMGCSTEPWLLTRSLGLVLQQDTMLTMEDGLTLFISVTNNNIGHRIAVSFIREKWRDLLNYYGIPDTIYKMVYSTVTYMNTRYEIQELKKLISEIKKVTQEESVILDQAIETVENNIIWMAKNYQAVDVWLDEFNNGYRY